MHFLFPFTSTPFPPILFSSSPSLSHSPSQIPVAEDYRIIKLAELSVSYPPTISSEIHSIPAPHYIIGSLAPQDEAKTSFIALLGTSTSWLVTTVVVVYFKLDSSFTTSPFPHYFPITETHSSILIPIHPSDEALKKR